MHTACHQSSHQMVLSSLGYLGDTYFAATATAERSDVGFQAQRNSPKQISPKESNRGIWRCGAPKKKSLFSCFFKWKAVVRLRPPTAEMDSRLQRGKIFENVKPSQSTPGLVNGVSGAGQESHRHIYSHLHAYFICLSMSSNHGPFLDFKRWFLYTSRASWIKIILCILFWPWKGESNGKKSNGNAAAGPTPRLSSVIVVVWCSSSRCLTCLCDICDGFLGEKKQKNIKKQKRDR